MYAVIAVLFPSVSPNSPVMIGTDAETLAVAAFQHAGV
jgi:hypothetical protein